MFTNHYVNIAKTLFLFILLISIAITVKIFFEDTNNIENKSLLTGVIVGKAQYIGSTVDANRTWYNWFAIPVDTDGDGKRYPSIGYSPGYYWLRIRAKNRMENDFLQKDGIKISEFLPFLWRSVLDPNLPINTPQPVYISNGVYSTE